MAEAEIGFQGSCCVTLARRSVLDWRIVQPIPVPYPVFTAYLIPTDGVHR